jgi:hypothetical protein
MPQDFSVYGAALFVYAQLIDRRTASIRSLKVLKSYHEFGAQNPQILTEPHDEHLHDLDLLLFF